MRKIQALALFIVLLLTPAVQPGADAARPRRQVQEPPKPTVMEAFQQKLQDDPFFSDRNQQNLNNEIAKYIDDLLNRRNKMKRKTSSSKAFFKTIPNSTPRPVSTSATRWKRCSTANSICWTKT